MIVYRIQSKQDRTRGAYKYGPLTRWDNETPTALEDIGRSPKRDEYHGCLSAAQLLRWFRVFIPELLCAGYEIVALKNVTITAIGKYQVLFTWND